MELRLETKTNGIYYQISSKILRENDLSIYEELLDFLSDCKYELWWEMKKVILPKKFENFRVKMLSNWTDLSYKQKKNIQRIYNFEYWNRKER